MKKIETIQDFKQFLNTNRDKLLEHTVRVEDLPLDDDWDEVYQQEVIHNGKI